MYYKNVSSSAIIAKVYRDFSPTGSGWVFDAIEWIGEALEIIGHSCGYELKGIKHEVKEFRTKIKCPVQVIEGIKYNGKRLLPQDSIDRNHHTDRAWYALNPNYIQTSFEYGEITVFADVVATDCDGFPMIPDEVHHKQAISWYIMMMMLAKGYSHPTFKYEDCEKRWYMEYPKAQNAASFPSIDEMDRFRVRWNATIFDDRLPETFFDKVLPNSGNADQKLIEPKDNMRTIIHVVDPNDDIIGGGDL